MEEIEALLAKSAEHCHKTGRPWVTLSYAQSIDGCIAARPGQPLALSGTLSLTLTHQLRAAHDAILRGESAAGSGRQPTAFPVRR
jgi:3,4-dihydroxy 2-butanone 4-phosphate synthase/GTP cyclohydrolase II